MRLLIVTQKVDKIDPILGFFHRWIEEFAKNCEQVHVIGQSVGEHDFPSNVTVHSLGKENNTKAFAQMLEYWKLIRRLQNDTDAMLVHMTPIWVVLGCFFQKPVYLWYEARGARWPLRLAMYIVKKVFSASAFGMPLHTKKSVIVGHGIDLDRFTSTQERDAHSLVTVGRITRSKNLNVILEAFAQLPAHFQLSIIGTVITEDDEAYLCTLQRYVTEKSLKDRVTIGSLTQEKLVPILQKAQIFLHASDTSLDKAVLEALACGCPVVSTSDVVQSFLPLRCHANDAQTLAYAVLGIAEMNESERHDLQHQLQQEVQKHSLQKLIVRLVEEMKS